ncbi:hypothetical protein OESDEN_09826 [Oesophagostomum dentatum]|uniref:Uncharacterized protein n=1 Tax=Oesophagostomum dentatum TaxID=61180 RepID=A0A0B1T3F5_OESDE|nr:hypothetical protein OESDEN_09826 [Oesophagostomum dentatum]
MDANTQWVIAGLVLLLILLVVLLFSKTPFLSLFVADRGWEKLDESSGILEQRTPVRYNQPFDKAPSFCYSNPMDGFIKMSYGIPIFQDEKGPKQYLVPSEEIEHQLVVEGTPDVHLTPERRISDEQVQCSAAQLRRCVSTDSLDSTASSIVEVTRDVPVANMTLKYDEPTQMLSVQLHHLSDVYSDYGQIWLLFFLLPHPKPLWRTEARSTPSSFIDYSSVYQQCVRKADLHKIALLVQLYSSRNQSASIVGQSRIRLKDLSLASGDDAPVELALQPSKTKSPVNDSSAVKLGEILFLATFSQDRLTVIVSKIRNLTPVYKSEFLMKYSCFSTVTKKKTSEKILADGAADIGESMFFSLPRSRAVKSHLRLSIVCGTDGYSKSIGHVTLGPKSSGKEFGHWKRALSGEGPPLATWHAIRPRSTV